MLLEEGEQGGGVQQGVESEKAFIFTNFRMEEMIEKLLLLLGHEQRDCEGLVLVREGDQHEGAAGPDVEVVRGHLELDTTN